MGFETTLADALYVNWAVPCEQLPEPPAPLRLDSVVDGDAAVGFVTLVLFRQRDVRSTRLPWPRLEFPQCNLRLPARDAERVPSIWLLRQLVPAWVVPLGRWVARQPVSAAILRARRLSDSVVEQRWEVAAGRLLVVRSRASGPPVATPSLGGWDSLVAFFRERPRGYLQTGSGLRRIEAAFDHAAGLPCTAEIERADWLVGQLPSVPVEVWKTPHSAFVVPATRLVVQRSKPRQKEVAEGLPVPSSSV